MAEDIALVPRARQALLRLKETDGRTDLTDRLGEFFPHEDGLGWLTDYDDEPFREAFFRDQMVMPSGEIAGGWLDPAQHAEFWGYIREYSPASDTSQLAGFLERLLTSWEQAAATSAVQPEAPEAIGGSLRFDKVGRVDGYPGWWQGYDVVEGVWKYVRATDTPGDQTSGWLISAHAFPEMSAEGSKLQAQGTADEHARAVYALVLEEATDLTQEETDLIWSDIWARVTAAHGSVEGWTSGSGAEIADEVLNAHFSRLLAQPEEAVADDLIAELQAIRVLLMEHARSQSSE